MAIHATTVAVPTTATTMPKPNTKAETLPVGAMRMSAEVSLPIQTTG